MRIRKERPDDIEIISRIHYAAFKNHPVHPPGAEPVEHRIVERLRATGALHLSLIAEIEEGEGGAGERVGHIAMSSAVVGDCTPHGRSWYLLGPVGVTPNRQSRGVGSALIRESLHRLQQENALGVVLVGDPGFYHRFGFRNHQGLSYPGVPEEYVLALAFDDQPPQGEIIAHKAFAITP